MSIIKSQNVNEIIRKTLGIINPKIIVHGEIVGYMLYKMLECDGRYSEQELLDYTMLGILHDIGLYREDGLSNVADFETAGSPWPHSIYGFLFLKYLSPIGDQAEVVLYHHLDYNRYGMVKSKYAHITECLALADKMDNFMRCKHTKIKDDYFSQYRNIRFSGNALDLFHRAEKEYGIMAKLASGEYRNELDEIMSHSVFSEKYKRGFLEMLVYSIDFRSEHTVVHTMSTVHFAMQLGRLMKVGAKDLHNMYYGALLHDLGKVAIPLDILESPGRLGEEEMRVMRAHVRITEMILSDLVDEDVLQIAARHHEKLDGTGYHKGLSEKDLTLPQQIVAVADMLSALYGKRSYKDSFDSSKIKSILQEDAEKHKISKPTVDCLMEHYDAVVKEYEEQKDETIGLYLRIKQQYEEIGKKLEEIVPYEGYVAMQIIIVGCGNVGSTIVEKLSKEGHNITVIDTKNDAIKNVTINFDVMGMVGNGAGYTIQKEAGIEDADLMIAVTGSDELNLLCCLIAKKAGGCHTIARVRNPVYSREINFIKEELGLSMVINPEDAAALEIARVLKFPSAIKIDTFAKGRIELVKYRIEENSILCDQSLKNISAKLKCDVLVCMVERGEDVYIPDGNFMLRAKDEISVVGSVKNSVQFFKKLGVPTTRAKNAFIVGGGETAYYLAKQLISIGIAVKIVEKDKARCEELSELLPQAMMIYGDGTDRNLLMEEGLPSAESFVALTNFDEENIMLSLFVKSISKAKLITKVHRISYDEIIGGMELGSLIYPKYITAESIVKHVRALQNSIGSNIETLYRMSNDRVEALEFIVKEDSPVIGIPLQELRLKPNMLICSINHKGNIITPGGQSRIAVGDTVVIVTTLTGLHDIKDILKS